MKTDCKTQAQRIVQFLRKWKRATNMELIQDLWIVCPWKRIAEAERNGALKPNERIDRGTRVIDGKVVTEYRLRRVKAAAGC